MSYFGTTQLEELTETLNELVSRLNVIASMANSGTPALRSLLLTGSTTAVTGTLTGVTTLTNLGTSVPANVTAWALQNQNAVMSNINNVVIS